MFFNKPTMMDYAVVFSGGGTRGAYEVGAWKALKKIGIPVCAVVGTSIGALNAALALQNDISAMEEIYANIEINNIMEVGNNIDPHKDIFHAENLAGLVKQYFSQKGIDNAPLRDLIVKYVNIDKIYNSPIAFGCAVFSLKDLSPMAVFKEDIPRDQFIDYLLASSCFPIFKSQKINGKEFYDGGISDNMPIAMLLKKGYRNILAIDINGMGYVRNLPPEVNDASIRVIRCSEDLGGTFEFNKDRIAHNIQMGYLDTLKTFSKVQGINYYFQISSFNRMLRTYPLETIHGIEHAASIYGFERLKIYSSEELLSKILGKHLAAKAKFEAKFPSRYDPSISAVIKDIPKALRMINTGVAVAWFEAMIRRNPSFRNNGIINSLFGDYICAACAMIALQNEMIFKYDKVIDL